MTTACGDLRALLARLEDSGKLRRISCAIDKDTELACLARYVAESFHTRDPFGMLFENVTGYDVPVAVNLYATPALYAFALGIAAEDILTRWITAMRIPTAPHEVTGGPVRECIQREPDLTALPIPTWTPGRDPGPYIPSAAVITKAPDTGVQNLATYRIQLQGPRTLGVFFGSRHQHGAMHHARWSRLGHATPIALVVGAPPAVSFAAAAKTQYGVDELTLAGGLAGYPVEVVRGATVDLLVPAHAEYIIEGFIPPEATRPEGPFGEALGYMNDAAPAPFMEVTAICHRRAPIFHGLIQQVPPSEGHLIMEYGITGPLMFYLREKMRVQGVLDLAVVPGSAGVAALAVQLSRPGAQQAAAIGRLLARLNFGQKLIYLVDDDVDIRDAQTLNWAVSARVDPARDITLLDGVQTWQLDPSVMHRAGLAGVPIGEPPYTSSLAVIDATVKCAVPALSLPPSEMMQRVLSRWPETTLPAIEPGARLARLLAAEHHEGSG